MHTTDVAPNAYRIDEELWKRLKVRCAELGMTVKEFVSSAIEEKLNAGSGDRERVGGGSPRSAEVDRGMARGVGNRGREEGTEVLGTEQVEEAAADRVERERVRKCEHGVADGYYCRECGGWARIA